MSSLKPTLAVTLGSIVVLAACIACVWPWSDKPSDAVNRSVVPTATLGVIVTFLITCRFSQSELSRDQPRVGSLFGVFTLVIMSIAFLVFNAITTIPTVAKHIHARVSRGKPTPTGVLLMIGASAIVFGFLDNYGMKLGTEALEDTVFWRLGKRAIAQDDASALDAFSDYFTTSNRDIIKSFSAAHPKMKASDVARVISKYEHIKSSSAMLGNTFSNVMGAMLSGGLGGIFAHLTATDGDVENASLGIRIMQNPVVRVAIEACFMALGCLVPVALHFRDASKSLKQRPGVLSNAVIVLAMLTIATLVALQAMVGDADASDSVARDDDWKIASASLGIMIVVLLVTYTLLKSRVETV